ncbi:DUF192 domain-containing protein [Geojedonia litorea]|uniref:DUF192 domain-containing protein n=1 Tax=Geojedonia litorea TaxID=1268269 RepID=A0ABV9MXM2_9FLAO
MRFIKILNIVAFLGVLGLTTLSCKEEKSKSKITPVTIEFKKEGELMLLKAETDSVIATLDIEIADNDYETQTGLMYRQHMNTSHAMLFIFPDSDYRSFYMRNTEIPLDIIYIDKDKIIVSISKNAKPLDETALPSTAPAQYVLEVNAGLTDTWELQPGDKIQFTKL